jgi:hypothetical protein
MTTIFLKSPDERTVTTITGRCPCADEYLSIGYILIDAKEARKLRRKIANSPITAKDVSEWRNTVVPLTKRG